MATRELSPLEILGLMTFLGLNRQQMAYLLDVRNVSTVSRLLNGRTRPTRTRMVQLETLMRMAEILREQARSEALT